MFARFCQEYGGQKLHIVEVDANDETILMGAICGRTTQKRGGWRMSINSPLGNLCGNCDRISRTYQENIRIVEF